MKYISTTQLKQCLPFGLRRWLVAFALWRMRYGQAITPIVLLICLTVASIGFGYGLAMRLQWQSHPAASIPNGAVELAVSKSDEVAVAVRSAVVAEIGLLQADMARLQVMFQHLVDMSGLDGGEFDLEMDIDLDREALLSVDQPSSFPERGTESADPATVAIESDDSEPPALQSEESIGDDLSEEALMLVNRSLDHISAIAERLLGLFRQRRQDSELNVSGLPVKVAHVTSTFGYRINPVTGRRQLHQGIDFKGELGSEVLATANGIVTYSGKNGGYGNLVELEHAEGYRTRYAHNYAILVPVGKHVRKGDIIATMGSTGRSTGTHVHFEVRHQGKAVDPQGYLH